MLSGAMFRFAVHHRWVLSGEQVVQVQHEGRRWKRIMRDVLPGPAAGSCNSDESGRHLPRCGGDTNKHSKLTKLS